MYAKISLPTLLCNQVFASNAWYATRRFLSVVRATIPAVTRRIDNTERRARLAIRHRLAGPPAHDPVEVTRDLVVLHATDAATVYLGAAARLHAPVIKDLEHALYADRSLIRMLGMRRTMFVAPVEHAPIVQAACTDAIAVVQRKLLLKHLAEAGHDGGDPWLRDVEQATLAALAARGSATAAQLSADEPRLRTQLSIDEDKSYGAAPAINSRVLNLLSMQGLIVRGRPRGTWLSTQYEWAPADAWVEGGLHRLDAADARVELARLWLARFGPATPADLKWWAGWTGAQVKAALAGLDVEEVTLDGGETAVVLADDTAPVEHPTRGWRCYRPSTRRSWVGSAASGTSGRTRPPCSTAPATPARRSGSTAASSAAGRNDPTARSSTDYSRTCPPQRRNASRRPRPSWRTGSATPGSNRSSARRWNGSCRLRRGCRRGPPRPASRSGGRRLALVASRQAPTARHVGPRGGAASGDRPVALDG